jgi:hypothetical protein
VKIRYPTSIPVKIKKPVKNPTSGRLPDNSYGDGRNLAKTVKNTAFALAVLRDNIHENEVQKNLATLCILDGNEDYGSIKKGISSLISELHSAKMNGVLIRGKRIHIRFKLSGDMKFLLCVSGLNGPVTLKFFY